MPIYNYTTLDDPLGTNGTIARGINDAGQIVGYYLDSSNVVRWLRLSEQNFRVDKWSHCRG